MTFIHLDRLAYPDGPWPTGGRKGGGEVVIWGGIIAAIRLPLWDGEWYSLTLGLACYMGDGSKTAVLQGETGLGTSMGNVIVCAIVCVCACMRECLRALVKSIALWNWIPFQMQP